MALTKGKIHYNAFVVLEQDLELIKQSLPSEFDGFVGFTGSIGIALLIAILTCEMPEWLRGVFGALSATAVIVAFTRFIYSRRKKTQLLVLIERIKNNRCSIDQQSP